MENQADIHLEVSFPQIAFIVLESDKTLPEEKRIINLT